MGLQEIIQTWGTLIAAGGAFASGLAAMVAIYFYREQSRQFETDFSRRALNEENNSLNLSRFYRNLLQTWADDLRDAKAEIENGIRDGEVGFREALSLLEGLDLPSAEVKDYHLINYRPGAAFYIIKSQFALTDVHQTRLNFCQALAAVQEDEKYALDADHILLTMREGIEDAERSVTQGLQEIRNDIRAIESAVDVFRIRAAA